MNKVLLLTVLFGVAIMPMSALAGAAVEVPDDIIPAGEGLTVSGMIGIITLAANWLYTILLVVAAIYIVWAGFTYVTSGGKPEKLEEARAQIKNALIGIAIAVVARGLVEVVKSLATDVLI